MPAKDVYHDAVKQALIKDGWKILKENYELEYRGDSLYPDFAAEKSIAAIRDKERILVEVIKLPRTIIHYRSTSHNWSIHHVPRGGQG